MRPFQIILLAVFGLLALVGLLVFSNFKGFGGGTTAVGKVTIWGTLSQNAMDAEIGALRANDQSFASVTYVEKPEEGFDEALAEAIASGVGPDMTLLSQEHLVVERNKLSVIGSIPERTYLDTFAPLSELYLTTNGTFGIPFVIDPLVMYYNRSVLSSAGFVGPPTSWEAVTGLSNQLTKTATGQISQSVVPFGVYDNVQNARAIVSLLLMQSGAAITTVGNNGLRSTLQASGITGGVTPAESAMSFYTQFADPAKTVYTWNASLPDARQAFTSGNLVLYPGYASEQPILSATNPNLDFDMAAIPQPQTSKNRITYGKVYAFSIPKASTNAPGALLTATALTDTALSLGTAQRLSMAPATRTGLSKGANGKYTAIFYPEALAAKGWLSPAPSVTDRIFSTMIRSITSGRAQVTEALSTANQAIDSSL